MTLAVLAILQPDARASARLADALGDAHEIVLVVDWEELERAVAQRRTHCCLVDAHHPTREEAPRRIEALQRLRPEIAIVAYVDAGHGDDYFDLGGRDMDGLATSATRKGRLRAEIDDALSRARARAINRLLDGRFAAPGPAALGWAVEHAASNPDVGRLASALGTTPRGLREGLGAVGMPPPRRVLLWGRLLLAGARMAEDGRGAEEVAFSLGYATATSLARAMKRHTGRTLREISEGGGMRTVCRALLGAESGHGKPASGGPRGGPGTRSGGRSHTPLARALSVLFGLLGTVGCAAATAGGGIDRDAIRSVLESPGIAQMHVGVLAVDPQTGRTLYAHNPARKFVPASNQKILVTATAMSMLGADHRYRTEVWARGQRAGSVLHGDVVLVASGDPTLSGRYWPSGTAALDAIADSLRAAGVTRVSGALVVDVSAWDSATVGPTWEVEDLRYAYGSTGGAFAVDEGEIDIVVRSGSRVGAPAGVRWTPLGEDAYVLPRLTTVAPDGPTRLRPSYLPESRRLELSGTVAYGTVDTVSFALRDPVRQASAALARAIEDEGIELDAGWKVRWTPDEASGDDCEASRLAACTGASLLFALESPPLSEVVEGILEPSQNWMTEQLIRSLPALYGGRGSWSEGTELVESFLFEHVGVDSLDVSARDGSGLSAYNLVTPRALVQVLLHMREGPHADRYRLAMAEPGEEGSSLRRRLPGLEGRVFAKTGTISNVNSLSGYLVRDDGGEVVFSILTNGSGLPASYVREAIDDVVRALAR